MVNIDASLTHDNEIVKMSNRLCLDIAVNGLDVLQKDEYVDIVTRLKSGYSAWVIYTLYDVIGVLKMKLSVLNGFKELVSRGGDTDTNCAIYGAIRGYREKLEVNLDDYLDKGSQRVLEIVCR